jgi:ABC-type uncharacterized transport system permease subunit
MLAFAHVVLALAYAALAWHFWRTRWRQPSALAGRFAAWERAALTLAVLAHAALLWGDMVSSGPLRFGFAHALSAMMLVALLAYGIESLYYPLDGLPALVLPPAAVAVLLPVWFSGAALFPGQPSTALLVHVGVAMAAYALFTVGAAQAVLMAVAERQLHRSMAGGSGSVGLVGMPPLLTMEKLLFQIIGVGFVLLTLTLASGLVFSELLFGKAMRLDHKTVFAWVSWLIFAALLAGRVFAGWRGRTALNWALWGYGMLLLAYVGSRFVLEVVLKRYG